MARVTVEDCLDNVDNRFELVLVSSKRARQISKGAEPLVEWENDKPTVVALREIAEGLIDAAILDEVEVESSEWTDADDMAEVVAEVTETVDESANVSVAQPEGEIDVAAALAAALAADLGSAPSAVDSTADAGSDVGSTDADSPASAEEGQ